MEECCVVCAEPLEWVGYGVCGHRDVCSTCIARLRFVLNDKHCCICKQECISVFMTKALGDFTSVVKDFEVLHKCGNFWFESSIQAFFDDEDHYTMVKAMCRLSCQICEQAEGYEFSKDFVKKGHIFKSLYLLQRHILIAHKVEMCSLCLESRKIFICEQKLYSKNQLERHSANGDSEVDGDGEESGGFSGHPMCKFCQIRYYSDNELYHHMSVDHYLCHICQRLHPGHYDYFNDYDDLEAHFRHKHSLCEHPDCLAKKFVVFTSDVELKRHNALTHGGNMSRAQRNAALQIPVSFHYRQPPRRGHASSLDTRNHSNGRMSLAHGRNLPDSETGGYSAPHYGTGSHSTEMNAADRAGESPLTSEPSRYLTAAGGTMLPCLEESAFPPLPGSTVPRRKAKQRMRGPLVFVDGALGRSDRRGSSTSSSDCDRWGPSTSASLSRDGRTEDKPSSSSNRMENLSNRWQVPGRQVCSEGVVNVVHTASAIKLGKSGSSIEEKDGKLPVSEPPLLGGVDNGFQITKEVRSANKALSDCIRSRLSNDEKLFKAFKDMSAEFRKGKLDASLYCRHVTSLGLWDLVPELARLCPEPERQRSLLDAYEEGLNKILPVALREGQLHLERYSNHQCIDGDGKDARNAETSAQTSVFSSVDAMMSLRLTDRGGAPAENNTAEAHSRDGSGECKGSQKAISCVSKSAGSSSANCVHNKPDNLLVSVEFPGQLIPFVTKTWICNVCTLENNELVNECAACETSRPNVAAQCHGKRTKKIGKFERLRLDHDALLPPPPLQTREPAQKPRGGGAWKSGGGQRLVALAQRDAVIESAWRRS